MLIPKKERQDCKLRNLLEDFTIQYDSQDICAVLSHAGAYYEIEGCTGVCYELFDGEYGEIWICYEPAPYDLNSRWELLDDGAKA